MAAMISAAPVSAHHQPRALFRTSPTSRTAERYVQRIFCFESATAVREPSSLPDRRCSQDKTGMMPRHRAAITTPGVECRLPAAREGPDGIDGDERGEGKEGYRDDPQGQVLPAFRVLGGELPGQRQSGSHLDD